MFYANLRTEYSFRYAFGKLPDVFEAGTREGQTHIGICDRSSTFGHIKWQKICDEKGVTPIFGVELAVVKDLQEKKPTPNWMGFIARTQKGLREIYELVGLATSQFHYIPRINYEQVHDVSEDVAILLGSLPYLDALEHHKNFYVNLSPSTNKRVLDWAEASGINVIASADNFFIKPDDRQVYEILCGRNASIQTWPQWIVDEDEWSLSWMGREPAILAAEELCKSCDATLQPAELLVPSKEKSLLAMCEEGAERKGIDLGNPVYRDRLDKELELIGTKEYEDYFYIITDIVQFAKERMLVGPARGSSCGSLVCYLLDITSIDPIPFGLIFERFIDINRSDLPDIDIDFNHEKREQVFQYMIDTYGYDHVARLGTVALYKPKSAIGETAAALKIPPWEIDKFKNSILERSTGDARSLQAVEDTFTDTEIGKQTLEAHPELIVAAKLEGHARHHSQHAAGMILTKSQLTEHVAVDRRTGAIMCDKYDAEALNLLKIDALGLTQLSIIEDCLGMAGKDIPWLLGQDLEQEIAFDILNENKFSGIFQFQGFALQSLVQQCKITEFNDIASITALARPGPLHSGGATEWVQRKNGEEAVTYAHHMLEPILGDTYGTIIYQEQIMRIGREIGELSWEDVSALRKAMSKSLGVEWFNKYKDKFMPGALKNGMDPQVAEDIWQGMCHYGSWSFNKSHAVAYGVVSYWCCLLKALFPLEFAAASVRRESNEESVIKMLREMAKEGIGYVPFDKELSTDQWSVNGGKLVGPLTSIKGIGPVGAKAIVKARQEGRELPARFEKMFDNPITPWDDLYPITNKFRDVIENPADHNIISPITDIGDITANMRDYQKVCVLATIKDINLRDHNETGNIVKRGYVMQGQTLFLNMILQDDTSSIIGQIRRQIYERHGKPIVERGEVGNAVYLLKGTVRHGFRKIHIDRVRFMGYLVEKGNE